MHVTINHLGTDYSMSVVYNKKTTQFELQFASQSRYVSREATISSPYYREITDKFVQNCRFYGVRIPYIPTEEEFLGLAPRTLYPSTSKSQATSNATSKEVVNA